MVNNIKAALHDCLENLDWAAPPKAREVLQGLAGVWRLIESRVSRSSWSAALMSSTMARALVLASGGKLRWT